MLKCSLNLEIFTPCHAFKEARRARKCTESVECFERVDHKYVLDALHPCAIKHTRNQNTHIMITLENMILRKSPQTVLQRLSHPHVKRTAKALRRKANDRACEQIAGQSGGCEIKGILQRSRAARRPLEDKSHRPCGADDQFEHSAIV